MATSYGRQFELMMIEMNIDITRTVLAKRGIEMTDDDIQVIKEQLNGEPTEISITPNPTVTKPKSKGKGKGKGKASPPPDSPSGFGSDEDAVAVESLKVMKLGAKKKGKTAKPKCEATTAKGTPCSKCAIDGEIFCSVHIKKESGSTEKTVKKSKASSSKKKPTPKHTHGFMSPPKVAGECELCDSHGMPFENPEFEVEVDNDDPDYRMEEEDFDEIDD